MDDNDPISQFFPGEETVDLYGVLSLGKDASQDEIKKSYRKMALLYHPDKHANSTESAKKDVSNRFQQIGFAYAVLGDEKRKARYDRTGKTDTGFDIEGEDAWEAYFEEMFERVTRGKLDQMKKEYQGSTEEIEDLKAAYLETNGAIGEIMTHIPFSTHEDELRFVSIITDLISQSELPSLPAWETSKGDEKARATRKKESEKEAKEAEKLAKELGVWDEFYGTGEPGTRRGKGKKGGAAKAQDEEDHSVLQALILKKKEKSSDDFFDRLASKYAAPEKGTGRGKKRGSANVQDGAESPKKKSKLQDAPPEIDDEEFAKIQNRLFGDKAGDKGEQVGRGTGKSGRKTRK